MTFGDRFEDSGVVPITLCGAWLGTLWKKGVGGVAVPHVYMGTSLIRNTSQLGPYRRTTPRVLGGS